MGTDSRPGPAPLKGTLPVCRRPHVGGSLRASEDRNNSPCRVGWWEAPCWSGAGTGFWSQIKIQTPVQAVLPGGNHFASLAFSVLICKVGGKKSNLMLL